MTSELHPPIPVLVHHSSELGQALLQQSDSVVKAIGRSTLLPGSASAIATSASTAFYFDRDYGPTWRAAVAGRDARRTEPFRQAFLVIDVLSNTSTEEWFSMQAELSLKYPQLNVIVARGNFEAAEYVRLTLQAHRRRDAAAKMILHARDAITEHSVREAYKVNRKLLWMLQESEADALLECFGSIAKIAEVATKERAVERLTERSPLSRRDAALVVLALSGLAPDEDVQRLGVRGPNHNNPPF